MNPVEQESLAEVAARDHMVDRNDLSSLKPAQRELVQRVGVPYLGSLSELAQRVTEDLWTAIQEEYGTSLVQNPDEEEQELHRQYAAERRRHFVNRASILNQIRAAADESGRVIVCGTPGVGKSAIIAMSAEQRRREKQEEELIVERYVGSGPASLTAAGNRDAIWRQLIRLGFADELEDGADKGGSRADRVFREVVRNAALNHPLVLYLDGVNQLSDSGSHIDWIHFGAHWPPGLTVILGTVASSDEARRRYPHWSVVEIPRLDRSAQESLLKSYLGTYGKTLTKDQQDTILSKEEASCPLYLRAAAEELRLFPQFEELDRKIASLAPTVEGIFSQVLHRIEVDTDEFLVRTALEAIACGRGGMPEQELLEYLSECASAPVAHHHWARIHRQLRPYLKDPGEGGVGMLDFFHQQLAQAVHRRYLENPGAIEMTRREDVHLSLGRYYQRVAQGQTINADQWRGGGPRGHSEVVWHYLQGGENGLEAGLDLLMDFSFWMSRVEKGQLEGLIRDVCAMEEKLRENAHKESSRRFGPWAAFLRERAHVLRRGNNNWPAHKILLQLAMEHADESPVTQQADAWLRAGNGQWLRLQRTERPKEIPVSNTITVLEGHDEAIKGACELSNGTILSWDEGSQLRLWSVGGVPVAILEGHYEEVNGACEGPDQTILSWSNDTTVRIWNLLGEELRVLQGHDAPVSDVLLLPGGSLISCDASGVVLFWKQAITPPVLLQNRAKESADHTVSDTITPLSSGGFLMWDPWYHQQSRPNGTADVYVHNPEGVQEAVFCGHTASVNGCLECINGQILSWSDDETLRLWTPSGDQRGILVGHSSIVHRAVQLQDGRIVSWDSEGGSILWSSTGMVLSHLTGHTGAIYTSVIRSDGSVVTWTYRELKVTHFDGSVREISYPDMDGWTVCVAPSGAIIAKRNDGERTINLISPDGSRVTTVQHVADIDGIHHLSGNRLLVWGDEQIHIWDLERAASSYVREAGHQDMVDDLIMLADGRFLSWGWDGSLCLWDQNGRLLKTMKHHKARVTGACENTDGTLASWSEDGTIRLWSSDGTHMYALMGHTEMVIGVLFLEDNSMLSWGADGTIRIWASDGKNTSVLSGHTGAVNGVQLLDTGHILSWSVDGELRVWRRDGTLVRTLTGHAGSIHTVLLGPGGTILSCAKDAQPRIWSAEGDLLDTLQVHEDEVYGAIFQDQEIITWSEDQTVRVWRCSDSVWAAVLILGKHPGRVVKVRITDDEMIAASVEGPDGSYQYFFWDRTGQLVEIINDEECRTSNFPFFQQRAGSTLSARCDTGDIAVYFADHSVCMSVASPSGDWMHDCYWHADVDTVPEYLRPDGSVCVSVEDGTLGILVPHVGTRSVTLGELAGISP